MTALQLKKDDWIKFNRLFYFPKKVQEELTQKLLRKRYEARMKNVRLFRTNPGSNWFE